MTPPRAGQARRRCARACGPVLVAVSALVALLAGRPGRARADEPTAPTPSWQERTLILPFLGFSLDPTNFKLGNFDRASLRLGTLVGVHVLDRLSLDAGFAFEFQRAPWRLQDEYSSRDVELQSTLSALYHVRNETLEVVAGPRLGFFTLATRDSGPGYAYDSRVYGAIVGLQAGAFGRLWPALAIGGLAGIDLRHPIKGCFQSTASPRFCSDGLGNDVRINLSAAVLF